MVRKFDLYVYDKNLKFIGMIGRFTSLRWRRKYYEAGEFELHLPVTEKTKKFLNKDNIIIRDDAIEAGIIETVKTSDDGSKEEAVIIGRFLSSILDRRIIKNTINFSGSFLNGEREILNQMTPFKRLIISNSMLESENVVFQSTYKNVYEYLNKLSRSSTIAHRIIVDLENKQFIYENYKGVDRTETQSVNPRYEFSENKKNYNNADYVYNAKTEKNYALVGGQGEGANRTLVEVSSGNYDDFDLREVFVDAKSESSNNLTNSQYKEILKTKGKEQLSEPTESMEVTANTKDYRIRWDLGDIVNAKKESWGKSIKKRIAEIEEIIENANYKIYVTFGDPLPEPFNNKEN